MPDRLTHHKHAAELSAYLDGELSPERREAVEHWLVNSPAARELLADLQRVRGQLKSLPRVAPRRAIYDSIRDRLDAPAPHAAARPHWLIPLARRWGSAAAVLAACVVTGWFVFAPAPSRFPQPLDAPAHTLDHRGPVRTPPAAESAPSFESSQALAQAPQPAPRSDVHDTGDAPAPTVALNPDAALLDPAEFAATAPPANFEVALPVYYDAHFPHAAPRGKAAAPAQLVLAPRTNAEFERLVARAGVLTEPDESLTFVDQLFLYTPEPSDAPRVLTGRLSPHALEQLVRELGAEAGPQLRLEFTFEVMQQVQSARVDRAEQELAAARAELARLAAQTRRETLARHERRQPLAFVTPIPPRLAETNENNTPARAAADDDVTAAASPGSDDPTPNARATTGRRNVVPPTTAPPAPPLAARPPVPAEAAEPSANQADAEPKEPGGLLRGAQRRTSGAPESSAPENAELKTALERTGLFSPEHPTWRATALTPAVAAARARTHATLAQRSADLAAWMQRWNEHHAAALDLTLAPLIGLDERDLAILRGAPADDAPPSEPRIEVRVIVLPPSTEPAD